MQNECSQVVMSRHISMACKRQQKQRSAQLGRYSSRWTSWNGGYTAI